MTTPEKTQAHLIIESGLVQVKHMGSWSPAINNMELYQSDSIRTGVNSSASIILFKGSIIRLDENTEVTLVEIIQEEENSVSIQQNAGRTWNTVQKISGIDNYEIQTPTTVASVRGTSFDVNVNESGGTIVSVIRGIVNITKTINGTIYNIELNENYSITVSNNKIGQQKSFDQDEWIEDNLLKDEGFKEDLKEVIYGKIEPYIDDLKNLYGMTDEEIDTLIIAYINGDFSIPTETPDEYRKLFDLS
jgi:ferric-dicitrate binding protein FerR (iron transport regulator)